jgi:hypothetical protein
MRKNSWLPEETKALVEHWGIQNKAILLSLLPKRNWNAIKLHAKKLGLKLSTPWDTYYGKVFEKTKVVIKLTETERSYLAGLIDGEGSISFSQSTAKGRAFLCVPKLMISNTSEELCKWLSEKLSVVPLRQSRQKLNPKWRTVYVHRIVGYSMAPILEAILPYLVIKRKQAELMLAYFKERSTHCGQGYTDKELELADQIRNLNQRGYLRKEFSSLKISYKLHKNRQKKPLEASF